MVKREYSFTRELRLLTPEDFSPVFHNSPHKAGTPQILILGKPNQLGLPRLGIAIAKKNIKRAHERNRIKRLIRESFRLRQHELPHRDYVVIAKREAMAIDNHLLMEMLGKLWYRHSRLLQKS